MQARGDDYEHALSELRSGKKRTHWMWYIFPQIDGLALSSTSKHIYTHVLNRGGRGVASPADRL